MQGVMGSARSVFGRNKRPLDMQAGHDGPDQGILARGLGDNTAITAYDFSGRSDDGRVVPEGARSREGPADSLDIGELEIWVGIVETGITIDLDIGETRA